MGRRGPAPPGCRASVGCDVIYSERRGQSQKPEEIYHLIEELVPNGAPCAEVVVAGQVPVAQYGCRSLCSRGAVSVRSCRDCIPATCAAR